MSTIESLTVEELSMPLTSPFVIATGEQKRLQNVLVTVSLSNGVTGTGEAAPVPHITGETQSTALAACHTARDLIVGERVQNYRAIATQLAATLGPQSTARAGVEMAVFDALCRHLGCSLADFVGGRNVAVRTDDTISIVPPDVARTNTETAVEAGFTDMKVKVGEDVDTDVARVRAVADAAPDAGITVDANQGYTPKESIGFVDRLHDAGVTIDLLEQPVSGDDVAGLGYIRDAVSVPVAADESVFTPTDARRVATAGAADVINVKLMKSGLVGALDIIGIARAHNLRLMIGCMLESSVAIHTAAHLASGTGAFDHIDLDGNFSLETDFRPTTYSREIGIDGPGHGVEIGDSSIRTPRDESSSDR